MTTRLSEIDPETGRAIRAFLERVARDYRVNGARLYGSRARADHADDSDIDVAIFLKGARAGDTDLLRTKLALADIAFDVLLETDILVSPMPIWEAEWAAPETHSNPQLLENIRREGVVL